MWHADRVYFLSDRGSEGRANIWAYDITAKTARQVTRFADFDIHFPSLGPSDIVFEAGGKLYLLGLADEKLREVPVKVVTDEITLRPRTVERVPADAVGLPPSGKGPSSRPAATSSPSRPRTGPSINLTRTPGSAERYPAISPDGKSVAYWSDRTGEYELVIADIEKPEAEKDRSPPIGPGFRYQDQLVAGRQEDRVRRPDDGDPQRPRRGDRGRRSRSTSAASCLQGDLENFRVCWSPDSRWFAYPKDLSGRGSAIFLYEVADGQGRARSPRATISTPVRCSIRTANTSIS